MKAVPRERYVGECKRSLGEKRIVNTTYIIQLYILVRHNQNEFVKDKRSNDLRQPSRISESIIFWKILKSRMSQYNFLLVMCNRKCILFFICLFVFISYYRRKIA